MLAIAAVYLYPLVKVRGVHMGVGGFGEDHQQEMLMFVGGVACLDGNILM